MRLVAGGLGPIVVTVLLAVGMFALALSRRSWPLWLLALALTVAVLFLAYAFRDAAAPTLIGTTPRR